MEQGGIDTKDMNQNKQTATNTPNPDSFFQMSGLNGPPSNMPLIDVEIDQALSYIGKVSNEEFVNEVQKMRFKVRSTRITPCVVGRLPPTRRDG